MVKPESSQFRFIGVVELKRLHADKLASSHKDLKLPNVTSLHINYDVDVFDEVHTGVNKSELLMSIFDVGSRSLTTLRM